jgi:hypothetical protein
VATTSSAYGSAEISPALNDTVRTLAATGATVITFTGFDPAGRLPFGDRLGARVQVFNQQIRASAASAGAVLIDLWGMPELADPRLWGPDRLHLGAQGHRHVAGAVLTALGETPQFTWPIQVDTPHQRSRLGARLDDLSWTRRHMAPWLIRKIRGRAQGDGRFAKRPELSPYPSDLASATSPAYDDRPVTR